jgi:hypothetical protein
MYTGEAWVRNRSAGSCNTIPQLLAFCCRHLLPAFQRPWLPRDSHIIETRSLQNEHVDDDMLAHQGA